MIATDSGEWAQEVFGGCELGDARRTKRLVDLARRLAAYAGQTVAKCCGGDDAAQLGSYRLLRNPEVDAEAIAEGGFKATAQQAQEHKLLLALEDTTSVSYRHAAAAELGAISNQPEAKRRGYQAHSVLLVDAESECTLGLIDQQRWCRDRQQHGKKHARKQRAYADKESRKWQSASERMAKRLGPAMARTISVCDRESDIYKYLQYKQAHSQRFVTRASVDRRIDEHTARLFDTVPQQAPVVGHGTVHIPQRAGRRARRAQVEYRAMALTLLPPKDRHGAETPAIAVHTVWVQEIDAPTDVEPLCWRLLTSESITDAEEVARIVRYYELRWRIEEYHKAWKSGAGAERQRLQSADNLERMVVITAFVAVRLLQLRETLEVQPDDAPPDCQTVLTRDEWRVLWISTERSKPSPQAPSMAWAYRAIARLGGFTDTKRTGRAGWATIWRGWDRLQERLEGYQLSQYEADEL